MREARSVVFLDILQEQSIEAAQIYRVSLEGNVTVIAKVSLAIGRDWGAKEAYLYNGPQGGLILCDYFTVNEIRDGAVFRIKRLPSGSRVISGYSSKLNRIYIFGKRELFRQRLSGNDEYECVCYTEGAFGGYFEDLYRLVNNDDHTVYSFFDPSQYMIPRILLLSNRIPAKLFAAARQPILSQVMLNYLTIKI